MSSGEKILLIASGAFSVTALVLLMNLPANRLFSVPVGVSLLLFAAIGASFLLLVKFRRGTRTALVFLWILAAFFLLSIALFSLAVWAI